MQPNAHTHRNTYTNIQALPLRNFFMAAECHHGATPALAAPQLCSRVFWPAAQISPLLNYEWTSWLRWVPFHSSLPLLFFFFFIPLNEEAPLLLPSENNWMHVERVWRIMGWEKALDAKGGGNFHFVVLWSKCEMKMLVNKWNHHNILLMFLRGTNVAALCLLVSWKLLMCFL